MKNKNTEYKTNKLNSLIAPLTIYLAMVCDKIAARDAQQPLGTQSLADPEVASLMPESEAINITYEQLNEPTLAKHTIDTELLALFDEAQTKPLAIADLFTPVDSDTAGGQASSNNETYVACESFDSIPLITVAHHTATEDTMTPAGDDGGSHTGLIIGLFVAAAAITTIVLISNNNDDDEPSMSETDDDNPLSEIFGLTTLDMPTTTQELLEILLNNETFSSSEVLNTEILSQFFSETDTDGFMLGDIIDSSLFEQVVDYLNPIIGVEVFPLSITGDLDSSIIGVADSWPVGLENDPSEVFDDDAYLQLELFPLRIVVDVVSEVIGLYDEL